MRHSLRRLAESLHIRVGRPEDRKAERMHPREVEVEPGPVVREVPLEERLGRFSGQARWHLGRIANFVAARLPAEWGNYLGLLNNLYERSETTQILVSNTLGTLELCSTIAEKDPEYLRRGIEVLSRSNILGAIERISHEKSISKLDYRFTIPLILIVASMQSLPYLDRLTARMNQTSPAQLRLLIGVGTEILADIVNVDDRSVSEERMKQHLDFAMREDVDIDAYERSLKPLTKKLDRFLSGLIM